MLTGTIETIPLDSIIIERGTRQRRDLEGIPELAESIKTRGLIHYPVVRRNDRVLITGERRVTACRSLGWSAIPVQWFDSLSEAEATAIELEENIKRVDITWQERNEALCRLHSIKRAEAPDWDVAATAEFVGLTPAAVYQALSIAREAATNEAILKAPSFSVARGLADRQKSRREAAQREKAVELLLPEPALTPVSASAPKPPPPYSIINADFNKWAKTYSGPRFNFLHCDFPYGINADKNKRADGVLPAVALHGSYADSADTYWDLLDTLADNIDRLCQPECHIMFWFSMTHYQSTLDFFESRTDFVINPFPLFWMKSDNVGLLPDPQRGPRRIYETALIGARGDRRIVSAVANAYAAPTVRERHMSEKPEPVLRHFFRMFVDPYTSILDPTCGSGSAIRASRDFKPKSALGLEINPEFYTRAKEALK